MLSLQDRFILAVESVGLLGLSAFLALVRDVTMEVASPSFAEDGAAPSDDSAVETELGVVWLGQWVDEVVAYLENPAQKPPLEYVVLLLLMQAMNHYM